MLKVCLIDDKTYWIPQLIYSIPKKIKYDFYYYDKIENIEYIEYDIIFLDFYLDKDKKTALDIINNLKSKIIISFSSIESKNDEIINNWWTYKAKKLRYTNENIELNKLMRKIFIKSKL